MTRPDIPSTIDRSILQSYLEDHLSGAAAGRARIRKMSEWYADLAVGPDLARIAGEIDFEHAHLSELIDTLGLRSASPLRLVARVGEMVGRLKPNGRALLHSPLTPLLEVELMNAAVNGKKGLWLLLQDYATELGLNRQEYVDLAELAEQQSQTFEELHAQLRPRALRPQE